MEQLLQQPQQLLQQPQQGAPGPVQGNVNPFDVSQWPQFQQPSQIAQNMAAAYSMQAASGAAFDVPQQQQASQDMQNFPQVPGTASNVPQVYPPRVKASFLERSSGTVDASQKGHHGHKIIAGQTAQTATGSHGIEADITCIRDTGKNCAMNGVTDDRTKTHCINGRSICSEPSSCSDSQGVCQFGRSQMLPKTYRISIESAPGYFLYMDKSPNGATDRGDILVGKGRGGPDAQWRLIVMPDGKLLLTTEAMKDRLLGIFAQCEFGGTCRYRGVSYHEDIDAFQVVKTLDGKVMLMDVAHKVYLSMGKHSYGIFGCSDWLLGACYDSSAYFNFDPPLPEDGTMALKVEYRAKIGPYSFWQVCISLCLAASFLTFLACRGLSSLCAVVCWSGACNPCSCNPCLSKYEPAPPSEHLEALNNFVQRNMLGDEGRTRIQQLPLRLQGMVIVAGDFPREVIVARRLAHLSERVEGLRKQFGA